MREMTRDNFDAAYVLRCMASPTPPGIIEVRGRQSSIQQLLKEACHRINWLEGRLQSFRDATEDFARTTIKL